MELQQLRHFLAAVRHNAIGNAADEQNISQSGISRSIISLENRLGVSLLKRHPRGVELTPYGERLLPFAEAMVNQEKRALSEIKSLSGSLIGAVTLGVTWNYSHYFIPEILTQVCTEHNDLHISVQSGTYAELIDRISRRELDFVFGLVASGPTKPELVFEDLITTRSVIVAGPNHPLASKDNITIEDLSNAKWALWDSEAFQIAFADFFYAEGLEVPGQLFTTNSFALLKHNVLTRGLLTILPTELITDEIEANRIVKIDSKVPADSSRAGLIYRDDAIMTPAIEHVMEVIRRVAKETYSSETSDKASSGGV